MTPSVSFWLALIAFLWLSHSLLVAVAAVAGALGVSVAWRRFVVEQLLQMPVPPKAAVFLTGARCVAASAH